MLLRRIHPADFKSENKRVTTIVALIDRPEQTVQSQIKAQQNAASDQDLIRIYTATHLAIFKGECNLNRYCALR